MNSQAKSIILFGGPDEGNGDYSRIRECCETGNVSPGWSCQRALRRGDEVWIYISKPVRAIVAVGRAESDATPENSYRYSPDSLRLSPGQPCPRLDGRRNAGPVHRWRRGPAHRLTGYMLLSLDRSGSGRSPVNPVRPCPAVSPVSPVAVPYHVRSSESDGN